MIYRQQYSVYIMLLDRTESPLSLKGQAGAGKPRHLRQEATGP
jgi:hypothetical protein